MESVYSALFPDGLKLRKLQDLVRDEATVDALWNMYILSEDDARALSSDVFNIFSVRPLQLLVLPNRAMRRPQSVGRANSTGSHAFLFYNQS